MAERKLIHKKSGDGEAFYKAFKVSGKTAHDVYSAMTISNGTLYNLFNTHVLDEDTKRSAAAALGKTVGEIFGELSTSVASAVNEAPDGFHRNARRTGEPVDTHTNKGGIQFVELSEGYFIMYPHRVTVKARAGYLAGWGHEEYIDGLPTYPAVVKQIHKGNYMWFDIDGDSMDDGSKRSIEDGSMVLGREISRSLWKSKFHLKDYPFYVIVHITRGIVCKEITKHDTIKGCILCHSLNPNKDMYPDFELKLDECIQIFNVVKKETDTKG